MTEITKLVSFSFHKHSQMISELITIEFSTLKTVCLTHIIISWKISLVENELGYFLEYLINHRLAAISYTGCFKNMWTTLFKNYPDYKAMDYSFMEAKYNFLPINALIKKITNILTIYFSLSEKKLFITKKMQLI